MRNRIATIAALSLSAAALAGCSPSAPTADEDMSQAYRVAPGGRQVQVQVWEVPEGTAGGRVVWPDADAAQFGVGPAMLLG